MPTHVGKFASQHWTPAQLQGRLMNWLHSYKVAVSKAEGGWWRQESSAAAAAAAAAGPTALLAPAALTAAPTSPSTPLFRSTLTRAAASR